MIIYFSNTTLTFLTTISINFELYFRVIVFEHLKCKTLRYINVYTNDCGNEIKIHFISFSYCIKKKKFQWQKQMWLQIAKKSNFSLINLLIIVVCGLMSFHIVCFISKYLLKLDLFVYLQAQIDYWKLEDKSRICHVGTIGNDREIQDLD